MADYKAMYYRLAGEVDYTVDVLDTNTVALTENSKTLEGAANVSESLKEAYLSIKNINGALIELNKKLKSRLLETEEIYMNSAGDSED